MSISKRSQNRLRLLAFLWVSVVLTSCVDPVSDGQALENSASASRTNPSAVKASRKLNKHDVALRFLTAFIRLDRKMALEYATPEAVASLDWNRPHKGNVPYYDDKMILHYTGGWARVYFQEYKGSYRISKIEAYKR